ncbi:MAG: hypothetical protein FWD71_01885 [Oscillospiraceae bacterium]|nr:hypothetical protein [Oscillospiraceae bacterium]
MKFCDIIKNEKNIQIIKGMIKSGKLPGAFIFEGAPGSGKSSMADILAMAAVCQDYAYKSEYGEPCGVCEACRKAGAKIHPDIITAESESDSALSFHIDKVREIIDGLYLSPNESDKKIYIIKNMQNMTPQGQNALLKSIEEPPHFVIFIITVNSCDLILETVKSRAVRFTMDYISETEIRNYIEKNNPGFGDNEIAYAAKFANGSIGAALDMLQNRSASQSGSSYGDLIYGILSENPDKLSLYQNMASKGFERLNKTELLNFYSALQNAVRDILIAKIFTRDLDNPGNVPFLYFNNYNKSGGKDTEKINKLLNLYSAKKIIDLSGKIHKFKSDLDYNINARLNLISFLSDI